VGWFVCFSSSFSKLPGQILYKDAYYNLMKHHQQHSRIVHSINGPKIPFQTCLPDHSSLIKKNRSPRRNSSFMGINNRLSLLAFASTERLFLVRDSKAATTGTTPKDPLASPLPRSGWEQSSQWQASNCWLPVSVLLNQPRTEKAQALTE
jgi:hypothetical protein